MRRWLTSTKYVYIYICLYLFSLGYSHSVHEASRRVGYVAAGPAQRMFRGRLPRMANAAEP